MGKRSMAPSMRDQVELASAVGPARSHYCPQCPANDRGNLIPMRATVVMPGRRVEYHCPEGHSVRKGQTLLRSSPKAP